MSPLDQWNPLSEAAELVHRSVGTLKMRIQLKSLKATKIGKMWFIHLSKTEGEIA